MTKALFFDIDGTLVSFHTHRVPQSTLEAVHAARQKGIKVFIATGLDDVCHYYGWDITEVMAFGDGGNDMDMLRHAGIGVAMGNARPEVQACADYVTATVDEDGVAKALRHFGVI